MAFQRLGYLADFFSKSHYIKWSCHFKENQWWDFAAMIKIWTFKKRSKFLENLYLPAWAWQLSNIKEFSDEIGSDIN